MPIELLYRVLLVCAVVATTFFVRTRREWILLICAWILIASSLWAAFFGVGFSPNFSTFIGKLIGLGLAIACIVLGTVTGVLMARRKQYSAGWQFAGGLLVGALGIGVGIFVGLFSVCALTGDCL